MGLTDLETQRKRLRRLRLLQTLNQNKPNPTGDGLLRQALRYDEDLGFTQANIRNSLDYLEQRGLVIVTKRSDELWVAKISADGCDFLDGIGQAVEGVAHPDEF